MNSSTYPSLSLLNTIHKLSSKKAELDTMIDLCMKNKAPVEFINSKLDLALGLSWMIEDLKSQVDSISDKQFDQELEDAYGDCEPMPALPHGVKI